MSNEQNNKNYDELITKLEQIDKRLTNNELKIDAMQDIEKIKNCDNLNNNTTNAIQSSNIPTMTDYDIIKMLDSSKGTTTISKFYWFYMEVYLNDYLTLTLNHYMNDNKNIVINTINFINDAVITVGFSQLPGPGFIISAIKMLIQAQWLIWNMNSYNKGNGIIVKMAGSGGAPVIVTSVSSQ